MFTGIIEEIGKIRSIERRPQGVQLWIQADLVLKESKRGDSLALNGCCLTISELTKDTWTCHVVQETLKRTNLSNLKIGQEVNLERAVCLKDRLGGHLVQGHVDEVGYIVEKNLLSDHSWEVTIQASPYVLRYLIYKGSIAVEGVSLTIAKVLPYGFSFAMIPHTAQFTNLKNKEKGEAVNLEIDLIAKYVERLLLPSSLRN